MTANESNTEEQLLLQNNSNIDSKIPRFSVGDRVMLINLNMPREVFQVEEVVQNTTPVLYVLRGENNVTCVYNEKELLEYYRITEDVDTNHFLEMTDNPQFTENILQEIKINIDYVPIKQAVLKFQTQISQDTPSITTIKRYLHNNYKSELDIRKIRSRYMVNKQLLDSVVFDLAEYKELRKKNKK